MYLRHKSIQIMKEEQRREKELVEAKQKSILNSIQMDRERTLGRYVQFRRHSLSTRVFIRLFETYFLALFCQKDG